MNLFGKKKSTPQRQRTPASNRSVYSYHSKRSERTDQLTRRPDEVVEKKQVRKKRKVVQHIPALFLVIVIMVSVLYLSTVDTKVRVVVKDDKNTTLRDPAVYQEAATKFVNGSIVNHSKLLFDSQGLTEHIKQEFPEIAAATVTLPVMGRRPVVSVQTTKPGFILVSDQNAYVVGTNGVALLNVRDGQNVSNLGLRTVNDESGVVIEPGKAALPQEQALFISTVVEQLEKQGLQVESLTIPSSPYDLNVKLVGASYYVKFNILEDPKQQAGSFIALKKKLDSDKVIPKEYIDVRVGERVFYR